MFGTGSCSILCSQLLHYTDTVLHVLTIPSHIVTGCHELGGFNQNPLCNTVSVDTKESKHFPYPPGNFEFLVQWEYEYHPLS